ncbi:hypothetical protein HOLleu_38930 [Holothuria leucospilota]|uniref:Uncharacterized protein n=1 Tax=Holothuria leucospilota TaxID=206669 RepID=A0A9Q0YMN0_HOLLE|nr:hypothetical protein HOLleu_38930 [Holothuria leucospilota]
MEESMTRKLEDFENRSRRQDLVFFRVPELGETQVENQIKKDILETLMGFPSIETERIHRSPGGPRPNHSEAPRPIHVRFLRYSDREKNVESSTIQAKRKALQGFKDFYL